MGPSDSGQVARGPGLTPFPSRRGEYAGIEYAELPVNYVISTVTTRFGISPRFALPGRCDNPVCSVSGAAPRSFMIPLECLVVPAMMRTCAYRRRNILVRD